MTSTLIQNWWAFVLRGILAIVFGLIALILPGVTILSLVLVFAAMRLRTASAPSSALCARPGKAKNGATLHLRASSASWRALPRPCGPV